MPIDPYDLDEDMPAAPNRKRRFQDFDCPSCSANNPRDERFGDGDEVMCFYCGSEFRARVNDDGRLLFKEI